MPIRRHFPIAWLLLLFLGVPAHAQREDIAAAIEQYCERHAECVAADEIAAACIADQPDLNKAAGVDDPICVTLVDLMLEHYRCQTTISCDALLDPAQVACAGTGAPLLDLLLTDGAGACFDGRPPVNAPEGWTCAPHYYNGGPGDGCDCGCGALDRDCELLGVVGCADGGCFAEGCDFCYLEGDNVTCDDGTPPPSPPPQPLPSPAEPAPSCAGAATGAGAWCAALLTALRFRRRAYASAPSNSR